MDNTKNKGCRKKPRKKVAEARNKANKLQRKDEETIVFDPAEVADTIDSSLTHYRLMAREAELTLSHCQENGSHQQALDAVGTIVDHFQGKARGMEKNKSFWSLFVKRLFGSETSVPVNGGMISQVPDETRKQVLTRRVQEDGTDEVLYEFLLAIQAEAEVLDYLASTLCNLRWNAAGATEIIVGLAGDLRKDRDGGRKVLFLEDFLLRKRNT